MNEYLGHILSCKREKSHNTFPIERTACVNVYENPGVLLTVSTFQLNIHIHMNMHVYRNKK
jgi:hypothetical protein